MRRALFFICVTGLFVYSSVLLAEETPQLQVISEPAQQPRPNNITLKMITTKTSVDQTTGAYEIVLIGRIVLAQPLPETGSIVMDAKIKDAGPKGAYGLWFFNTKLQRFCARQERKDIILPGQFIPLAQGHVYDFLWSGRVAPDHKPVIDLSIENADGSEKVQVSTSVDPSASGEWFVSGQRFINGTQEITLPVPSFEADSQFVQFIRYGCLKPPFPEGILTSGDKQVPITLDADENAFGCKWWVTTPVRIGSGHWTFQPAGLPGAPTQTLSLTILPLVEPDSDTNLSARR